MPSYTLLFLLLFISQIDAESLRFGTFNRYMFLGRKPECRLDHGQEDCRMNRAFQGYCAALMELLAGEMKVDYRIDTRKPWAGTPQADGTWDGLLGDVNASVVDLAIAPLAVTPERSSLVDFSPPFLTSGLSIMIKKPDAQLAWIKQSHSPNPFAPTTWSVLILLQIMFIAISIMLYVHMRSSGEEKRRRERFCIWLFSFLVWIGCTVVLAASILHHISTVSVLNELAPPQDTMAEHDSLEELVGQENIKFIMQERGEAHQFFKNSKSSLLRNMLESMERNTGFSFLNIYESGVESVGVNAVRASDGEVAFIMDDITIIYESSRLPCSTRKFGENLATFQYAVATKKGSELSGRVRIAMESLKASGDLERLNQNWFAERVQCQREKADGMVPVSNYERNADYVIYAMCLGISISIILSLILAHFEKKQETRRAKFTDEIVPMNA
ncbi:hypothetical protein PENTCL1PPCAC_29182 [Pristionchus entomophagus]|uniref:Ionotropic glutamate receptor C-terminal domain-containing protein n=1 Tax=Pristionchus entomophagus TaxID=358040 RepID=A0AAV5UJX2_9BILA|nr:hypothetical protein PENTCL1PPCAC_29182 [Pristionchus entomophagus]